jgi:hypothetical protein
LTPNLSHTVPVLASADVEATLAFCEQKLGFVRQWTEGSPPTDAAVKRDGARIMRSYVVELPPGYRLRFAEGLDLIARRTGAA